MYTIPIYTESKYKKIQEQTKLLGVLTSRHYDANPVSCNSGLTLTSANCLQISITITKFGVQSYNLLYNRLTQIVWCRCNVVGVD